MRHALGILGVCAAAVLLLVSAAMNWRFGFGLGKTEIDSQIYGAASAAADILKALLPFFLFAAFRNRNWSQGIAALLVWGVCLSYSLTSSLGFAALNRADTTGARQVQAESYKDMRTELERLRTRLSWMPQHRPAGMVKEQISSLQQERRWKRTKGCTDATTRASIAFCRDYRKLAAELAVATEATRVEARIAELKASMARVPVAAAAMTEADPQAALLARLTGRDLPYVQMALIILVSLLVEVGSSLGFYVVFSQWRIYDKPQRLRVTRPKRTANDNRVAAAAQAPAQPKLVAPETDVERFYKDRIEAADGSSLTATALYEDYCAWCEERGKEPMALPTFGRQLGEMGIQKAKIAGRIRYIGVRLHSEEGEGAPKVASGVAA